MIYLIDDKKTRQKDFGWTEEKFAQYASSLTPLYNINDVARIGENLYNDGNIILYHESFLDFTSDGDKAVEQRNKLTEKADANNGLSVVFFSGSQSSRSLHENVAHLPVAILYQNLEVFIHQDKQHSKHLKYLLFGETPEIEEKLNEIVTQANIEIETGAVIISGNNLFIRPNSRYIQNAIEGASEGTIFNDVSDEKLSEKINDWLRAEEYDNIFVPLCFGQTLSDYNGLRLATHIRCTETPNQLKRVFIYSFVGIEYLLQNECFNILKTKNVKLVAYSKKAFQLAASCDFPQLDPLELPKEIKKLELQPPKNYQDNHSIANEWAIHQWAKTVDTEDNVIESLTQRINSNLYFKYLQTIYPIFKTQIINDSDLKINYSGTPKILYIDDEADKGWYEVFCKILYDVNNLDFDYLGDDFKDQTEDEIIENSFVKVKEYDADIVILDFRLHQNDFEKKDINEVTGIKILKEIKEYNPGIQVIVFSATNKVWNLQAIQNAGADGFVVKESPENSVDESFTRDSIKNFIENIKKAVELNFLKQFYEVQKELKNELEPRKKVKHANPLPKNFVEESLKWLELSDNILSQGDFNESKLISSFLFKFSVLENISNRIIDVDNPIKIDPIDGRNRYKFQFRLSEKRLRNFIEDINNSGFYRKTKKIYESNRNLPWNIKILNAIDFITEEQLSEEELNRVIKKRNDFIHANATTGEIINISVEDLIFLNELITKGLKNIV